MPAFTACHPQCSQLTMVSPSLLVFLSNRGWIVPCLRLARGAGLNHPSKLAYTFVLRGGLGCFQTACHSHPPNPAHAATCACPVSTAFSFASILDVDVGVTATCAGCMALSFWSLQAMARRSVQRSVRTGSGTDQVCGAKERQGHAVYPALEQETTIHILSPFWCAHWASKGSA